MVIKFINPIEIRPVILGCAGASIIVIRWYRLRHSVSAWTLALAPLCVMYVFLRAWLFSHTYTGSWTSLDTFPYFADQGFGFNPSLSLNHWVEARGLFGLIEVVYESLMLAVAVTYAYSLGRNHWRVAVMMILAGIAGAQAYRLLPACGPVYLLGSSCYLGQENPACAVVNGADLHPVPMDPSFPRNAVPSMHVAWALLVFWVWRTSRWKYAALAYLLLTMLATVAGGEHYLVDLIAAFPFAAFIWVICQRPDFDFSHLLAGLLSALAFLLWIAMLRFWPQFLHESSAVAWLTAAVLVIGSMVVVSRGQAPRRNLEVAMMREAVAAAKP